MLIQVFMQLMPGIFAVFYHSALGKTTAKKADDMSLSFIIGTEIFTALFFVIIYATVAFLALEQSFFSNIFPWIMIGIFFSCAIAAFLFYYRKGKGSELFISRKIAKSFLLRASTAKNRSDTIVLGFLSGVFELPFTLPLYIIVSTELLKNFTTHSYLFIFLYVLSAILPLLITHITFHTGNNLVSIMRSRTKNKLFFKTTISISYILIAILLILEIIL